MTTTMSTLDLATQALQSILRSNSAKYSNRWFDNEGSGDLFVESRAGAKDSKSHHGGTCAEAFPLIESNSLLPEDTSRDDSSTSTLQSSMVPVCIDSPTNLRRCCAIPDGLSELAAEQQQQQQQNYKLTLSNPPAA
ncbi:hypothetical protein MPSEU_001079300 [Mayamaea pseudoterrestris]|nr:hypothetical protein MPSEU_001079300 [Mayamaea pseudoterrestris]